MLPGLRLVLAAITATLVIVVLGFALLVKLQVAHSGSARIAPVEARFAGLAFAARADWTPAPARLNSLEALAPFAVRWPGGLTPSARGDAIHPARSVALPYSGSGPPLRTPAAPVVEVRVALAVDSKDSAALGSAPVPVAVVPDFAPSFANARATKLAALAAPSAAPALPEPAKDVTVWRLAGVAPAVAPAEPVRAMAASAITATEAAAVAPAAIISVAPPAAETLTRSVVPMPLARPFNAVLPRRRVQPPPAQQRVARQPVRQPAPPARSSPPARRPSNPLEALFGSIGAAN